MCLSHHTLFVQQKGFYLPSLITLLLIADADQVSANFVFRLMSFTLSSYAVSVFSIGHFGRQYHNVWYDCNEYGHTFTIN